MTDKEVIRIKSITQFHQLSGLPKPEHPLISIVDYSSVRHSADTERINWVMDFYSISVKRSADAKFKYGQQTYDFDEGVMFFIAPGQVLNISVDSQAKVRHTGWMLLVHPDFFWSTELAKSIKRYEFFNYSVREALFLSEKEELILEQIVENIRQEYKANIDSYSQDIMASHIGTLLNYAERFYQRQFITRKISNHQLLERLELYLDDYFNNAQLMTEGLPNVHAVADSLNVSPGYLTSVLKLLTGSNTQQHLQNKLIEKAKEKLSTTNLTISEVAYQLGFGHPQSLSKLFKSKTNMSPLEFRQSLN